MNIVRIVAIAALAAGVSTAAQAGGFEYGSAGGNHGNWAYADSVSAGDAKVHGGYYGSTYSGGDALSVTGEAAAGLACIRIGCGSAGGAALGAKVTGAYTAGENYSEFYADYGYGSAQSHTGSYAGSGAGRGDGYKSGYFEPTTPSKPKKNHR